MVLALTLTALSGCADESDATGHVFQYSSRSNGGKIAGYGDWVYYPATSGRGILKGEYFHRIRTDGTGWERMNWGSFVYIYDINIFGEWIYYVDGSDESFQKQKIGESEGDYTQIFYDSGFDQMQMVDDWIYYTDGDESNRIYKIHEDGSGRKKLTRDSVRYFCVAGNQIYYSSIDDGLCSISTKGNGKTKLADAYPSQIQVVSDWIYYSDGATKDNHQSLWKMRTDGTEKMELASGAIRTFCVADDSIYYSTYGVNSTYPLYKIHIDSNKETLLINENELVSDIYFYDECIFYLTDTIHIIGKDGTIKEGY